MDLFLAVFLCLIKNQFVVFSMVDIDKTLWNNAVKMVKEIHKKYNIDNRERTEDSLVESLVIRLIDFNETWKFIKRETKASKRDKACVDLLLFDEKIGDSLNYRFFAFLKLSLATILVTILKF